MEKEKIIMIVAIGGLAYYLFSQMSSPTQTTQTLIPQSVLIDNDPLKTQGFHTINF
jgi:hypothetical protein